MSSDYFSHTILTIIIIIVIIFLLYKEGTYLFMETFLTNIYLKNLNNYHKNSEDNTTKIIAPVAYIGP